MAGGVTDVEKAARKLARWLNSPRGKAAMRRCSRRVDRATNAARKAREFTREFRDLLEEPVVELAVQALRTGVPAGFAEQGLAQMPADRRRGLGATGRR